MALLKEKVTFVHHWTDKTFSFKTTRNMGFRFKNGEFAMIGLGNRWQTSTQSIFGCKSKS